MYLNIIKKTASGSGAAKEANVTIIAIKDITTFPQRDGKKVLIAGNFVLSPTAKIAQVYMTASKTKAPYENSGDEDSISLKHKFEGEHPGSELEINEFIAEWLNEPCVVIHGSCKDAFRKIVGTSCAPVQLKPTGQDDNDGRKQMLVFEMFANTELLPGHFTGALPTVAPFTVVSSTALALNATNGYVYQLPSLAVTASISIATTTLVHGDIVTLIGGGGIAPATLSSAVTDKSALLKEGATWTGLASATINLKVFKAGAVTLFEEISRS
jgi:hypothetical protein